MTADTEEQEVEDVRDEDAYSLDRKAVASILYAVDIDDREKLVELMEPLHAADIADLLEQINSYDRARLIRLYDREFDGEILSELEETVREEVIGILSPQVLAEAVRELDSDDVVDLVEDLEDDQQEAILGALEDSERLAVQRGLDPRTAALAWRIRLLAAGYEAASLRPPDNSVENTWLAALAQGDPQRALAPAPMAESIAEGFRDPARLPADLQGAFDAGQLGEVILEVIALYANGLSGNTGDMVAALSALRAIGLEDTARRAALQSVLLERG